MESPRPQKFQSGALAPEPSQIEVPEDIQISSVHCHKWDKGYRALVFAIGGIHTSNVLVATEMASGARA